MPASDTPLFDDAFNDDSQGSSLVPAHEKRPRTRKEQAVNRLLKQVETLRGMLQREKRRLDDALVFHAAEVSPRVQRLTALRADMVRALAPFLDDRCLKQAERRLVHAVVAAQLDEILLQGPSLDEQLKAIFERVHGISISRDIKL